MSKRHSLAVTQYLMELLIQFSPCFQVRERIENWVPFLTFHSKSLSEPELWYKLLNSEAQWIILPPSLLRTLFSYIALHLLWVLKSAWKFPGECSEGLGKGEAMALLKGKCLLHVNLPAGRLYKLRHLNPAGAHLNTSRLIPEYSFSSTRGKRINTNDFLAVRLCVSLSCSWLTEITKGEKRKEETSPGSIFFSPKSLKYSEWNSQMD